MLWRRLRQQAGSGQGTRSFGKPYEADSKAPPAPFMELQERQSTAVLPMSNGAPPAASGTTWSAAGVGEALVPGHQLPCFATWVQMRVQTRLQ